MGLLPLTYRRPAYVDKPGAATSQESLDNDASSGASLKHVKSNGSVGSGSSSGIPPALSFDRIVEGGTCPVCCVSRSG